MTILETSRLRLREFRLDDLDDLAVMVADEEQMRFYPATRTRDEARAWIVRNLSLYEEHGYGVWLIESRDASAFLGHCGIRPLDLGDDSVIEIGWHTKKSSWNSGIATEAATAVRDLAFARFVQTRLVALVPPGNVASRRVAEKIGLREQGETVYEGEPCVIYASDRA